MGGARVVVVVACAIGWVTACGDVLPANQETPDGGPDGEADASFVEVDDASVDVSFGSAVDAAVDAAGCVLPTCDGEISCQSFTFERVADAAACDGWTFTGNLASTTHDCTSGRLHIAGGGTDDIVATGLVDNPSVPHRLRVAARIGITKWDSGRVLRVKSGANIVAHLVVADLGAGAGLRMGLCDDKFACPMSGFDWKLGTVHSVVIETEPGAETTLTIDCVKIATIPAVSLATATDARTELQFGKGDANPIDATIDDVSVTFKF